jgi:phosphoenolpyruvate---glycerone phosphotransferase subunit DhaK
VQKIINGADAFVDEMLEGILAAHPDQLRTAGDPRAIVRAKAPIQGKVGIATGGGSGHLPVFMGYVGEGLADGAAIGNVFASPSAEQMLEVTRAVDGGAGVLYLYGNYGGDTMNFDLAAELADAEGIRVETVLGADDVASAPRGDEARRRGIAGIFLLYKVAGARAAEGATLEEVQAVAARAGDNIRSMGVALSPCIVPAAGRPTFELPAGEMEIGMGSTASRGSAEGPSSRPTASPSSSWGPSWRTSPTGGGTPPRCWSTGWGRPPRRSCTSSIAGCSASCKGRASACTGCGWGSTPPPWRWRGPRSPCSSWTTSWPAW